MGQGSVYIRARWDYKILEKYDVLKSKIEEYMLASIEAFSRALVCIVQELMIK